MTAKTPTTDDQAFAALVRASTVYWDRRGQTTHRRRKLERAVRRVVAFGFSREDVMATLATMDPHHA